MKRVFAQSPSIDAAPPLRGARAFFYIALFGLVASTLVHIATVFGVGFRQTKALAVALLVLTMLLHLRAVIHQVKRIRTLHDRFHWWQRATRNSPTWLNPLLAVASIYALFNVLYVGAYLSELGFPQVTDEGWCLVSHGKIVRNLTETEYAVHKSYVARILSSVAVVFQIGLAASFYSSANEDPLALGEAGSDSPVA